MKVYIVGARSPEYDDNRYFMTEAAPLRIFLDREEAEQTAAALDLTMLEDVDLNAFYEFDTVDATVIARYFPRPPDYEGPPPKQMKGSLFLPPWATLEQMIRFRRDYPSFHTVHELTAVEESLPDDARIALARRVAELMGVRMSL